MRILSRLITFEELRNMDINPDIPPMPSDQDRFIATLRSLYSDEILAACAYSSASYNIVGKGRKNASAELEDHAEVEFEHAEQLAQRIKELGSMVPNTMSEILSLATCIPQTGSSVTQEAKHVLLEASNDELCAIRRYTEAIELAEQLKDYASIDLLSKILSEENEHKLDFDLALDDAEVYS